MPKLWVIAGNLYEYNNYIDERARKGLETRNMSYLSYPSQLSGYSEAHGFFIGTWRNRTDIHQIVHTITRINGKRPVTPVDLYEEKIEALASQIPVTSGGTGMSTTVDVNSLEERAKLWNKIIREKVGTSVWVESNE